MTERKFGGERGGLGRGKVHEPGFKLRTPIAGKDSNLDAARLPAVTSLKCFGLT